MEKYDVQEPRHNMAYFIESEEDPVLKDLSDREVALMAIGTMPARTIDGVGRYITIGNDTLLQKLRTKYKNYGRNI